MGHDSKQAGVATGIEDQAPAFPYGGLRLSCLDSFRATPNAHRVRDVLFGTPLNVFVAILIVYAVIVEDVRVLVLPMSADFAISTVTLVVAVLLLVELVLLSVYEEGYFLSFYWICDAVATATLLLDVNFVALARYARLARFLRITRVSLRLLRASRAAGCAGRTGRSIAKTDERAAVPGVALMGTSKRSIPERDTGLHQHWKQVEAEEEQSSVPTPTAQSTAMPPALPADTVRPPPRPDASTPGQEGQQQEKSRHGRHHSWVVSRSRLLASDEFIPVETDSEDSDHEYMVSKAVEMQVRPTTRLRRSKGTASASVAPAGMVDTEVGAPSVATSLQAATLASKADARRRVRRSVLGETLIHRTSLVVVIGMLLSVVGLQLLSPHLYPNTTAQDGLGSLVRLAAAATPAEVQAAGTAVRQGTPLPPSASARAGDMASLLQWQVQEFSRDLQRAHGEGPRLLYLQLNGTVFLDAEGILKRRRRDPAENLMPGDADAGTTEVPSPPFEVERHVDSVPPGRGGAPLFPPAAVNRCGGSPSCAIVDTRALAVEAAAYSLGLSVFVVLLLLGWGLVFSINYHMLVIAPIERMVSRLRLLAQNPMLALSLIDPQQDSTGTVYHGMDGKGQVPQPHKSVLGQSWHKDAPATHSGAHIGSKPSLLPDAPPNLSLVSVVTSDAGERWYGRRKDSFYGSTGVPPPVAVARVAQASSSRKVVAGIRNELAGAVALRGAKSSRALTRRFRRRDPGRSGKFLETHIVEASLSRFGRLLQVVAGEAGAGIISRSLRGGSFDPVVPGVKTTAVFGFADIRNFTTCCEVFREETMMFTNSVSNVVHRIVHDCGGAVNKNIGDAFLSVWKPSAGFFGAPDAPTQALLDQAAAMMDGDQPSSEGSFTGDSPAVSGGHDGKAGPAGGSAAARRLDLPDDHPRTSAWSQRIALGLGGIAQGIGDVSFDVAKMHSAREGVAAREQGPWRPTVADAALQAAIDTMYSLAQNKEVQEYALRDGVQERMPGYRVRLGYGLHYGWAIEGAIGTAYKIDASYLSPHVNMAARLEEATKQFGVPILMSGPFVCLLSPPSQHPLTAYIRPVDVVRVKGSAVPIALFTFDFFDAIADGMLPWISPAEATFLTQKGPPSPSFMPTLAAFVGDQGKRRFTFGPQPLRRKTLVDFGKEVVRARAASMDAAGVGVEQVSTTGPSSTVSPPAQSPVALAKSLPASSGKSGEEADEATVLHPTGGSPFRTVWMAALRWYVEGAWEASARALLICKAMRPADGPTRVLLSYMHRHGVRYHMHEDGNAQPVPVPDSQAGAEAHGAQEAPSAAGAPAPGADWETMPGSSSTVHLEPLLADLPEHVSSTILRSPHWEALAEKYRAWVPGLHCPGDWEGHRGLMEK